MTSNVFAQGWSGARRAGRYRHRHGPHKWFFEGHGGGRPRWFFEGEGGRGRPRFDDLDDLIALRRMWKGGPFGGPGWGPRRRGRGRARRGDVRLALLRLLAEEPRNGYQLMQAIEERSEGLWRPSPGSVYPTLAQLEDEGLVRSVAAEGARVSETTDAGRQHLESRAKEPAPWEPA